jgi:hypothetical protein
VAASRFRASDYTPNSANSWSITAKRAGIGFFLEQPSALPVSDDVAANREAHAV